MEFSCSGSAVVRRELQYCMNKVLLFTFPSMLGVHKEPVAHPSLWRLFSVYPFRLQLFLCAVLVLLSGEQQLELFNIWFPAQFPAVVTWIWSCRRQGTVRATGTCPVLKLCSVWTLRGCGSPPPPCVPPPRVPSPPCTLPPVYPPPCVPHPRPGTLF